MIISFLLIVFTSLGDGDSSQSVKLSNALEPIRITDFRILEDQNGELDYQEVFNHNFQEWDNQELSETSVYWSRLELQNESNTHSEWMLYVGKNDFIDLYYDSSDGGLVHLRSGYQIPASQRAVPHASYTIPIVIETGETKTVFIRIEEDIHEDPEFDLKISSATKWSVDKTKEHWLDLFFQGFFWIMAAYNFLVYLTSREKPNLHYALYLTFVGVFYLFITGILREHLIAEQPWWTPHFMSTIGLIVFFYCAFLRSFLDTPKQIPFWDNFVKKVMAFNLISFVVMLSLNFAGEILIASRFGQLVIAVSALVGVTTVYLAIRTDIPVGKYFAAGTTIFVVSVLLDNGFWNPGSSEAVVTRFGLVGEILFFSVGLGQRIRIINNEKQQTQQELINQLTINEKLIEGRRDELEQKVKQRTKELEAKNTELTKAKESAEQAAKVKSDFLSVMSHEIRTPMNAVIGMTHILLEDNPKPGQLENLNTLRFSAESLLVLINDILDYSKIESGRVELEHIDFDLTEVVRGLGYMFRPRAQSHGIQFSILLDQETPTMLNGDPSRLTQVLNNLISNAIKFTAKGRVTLFIHLIKKTKDYIALKFVVEDTGIGIEKEKVEMIFDSFTQANFDTTRKYGGTGLGLAITTRLLHLFDTKIEVESELGKGSKFSFDLKLKPGKSVPKKSPDDTVVKSQELTGMNILVVDDNLVNRIMVERFLEKWKIKSQGVGSGKEALEVLMNEDFDLVLLDLQMPEMDGYEVARTIRSMKSERFINLPIVAISADTLANVYHKVLSAGMDDFLSKPFNPNELFNLVYNYSQLIKHR